MTRVADRRWLLLTREGPRGYLLLRDFILALENGEIPRSRTTEAVAVAFEMIIRGQATAESALGLKRKRGERRVQTAGDEADKYSKIWQFISSRLEGASKLDTSGDRFRVRIARGVRADAMVLAAKKFHREPRTIERIWKRYQPIHDFTIENRFWVQFVGEQLSKEELRAVGEADGRTVLRLAFDRRSNPGLSIDKLCDREVARRQRASSK